MAGITIITVGVNHIHLKQQNVHKITHAHRNNSSVRMTVVAAQWQYQIPLGHSSAIEWFTIKFDESAVVHLFMVATMTGHLFSEDRAFSIGIWSFSTAGDNITP